MLAVEDETGKPLAWQTCRSIWMPASLLRLGVDAEGLAESDWFILWTSYESLELLTVIESGLKNFGSQSKLHCQANRNLWAISRI